MTTIRTLAGNVILHRAEVLTLAEARAALSVRAAADRVSVARGEAMVEEDAEALDGEFHAVFERREFNGLSMSYLQGYKAGYAAGRSHGCRIKKAMIYDGEQLKLEYRVDGSAPTYCAGHRDGYCDGKQDGMRWYRIMYNDGYADADGVVPPFCSTPAALRRSLGEMEAEDSG